MVLQDALYVPQLRHNLLSVPALTQDGNRVSFEPDGTVKLTNISDDNSTTYDIGQAVGNIFHLKAEQDAYNITTIEKEQDTYTLWHH